MTYTASGPAATCLPLPQTICCGLQVIDYGLTKLDDHYSWASGWVETQLAEQRLRTSGSISAPNLERSSVVDDEVVAAASDLSVNQRLAQRQARKLQKKWTKPSGFEWCDASCPPLSAAGFRLR